MRTLRIFNILETKSDSTGGAFFERFSVCVTFLFLRRSIFIFIWKHFHLDFLHTLARKTGEFPRIFSVFCSLAGLKEKWAPERHFKKLLHIVFRFGVVGCLLLNMLQRIFILFFFLPSWEEKKALSSSDLSEKFFIFSDLSLDWNSLFLFFFFTPFYLPNKHFMLSSRKKLFAFN